MSRRNFLKQSSALGATSLLGIPGLASAEPPPEVRTVRFIFAPAMCMAPQYIAEVLLRAEGFEHVEYVRTTAPSGKYTKIWLPGQISEGKADFTMSASPGIVSAIDSGAPIKAIAGIHAGCYELFGHGPVKSVRALKGRTVAVAEYGDERLFISSMMAYVGLDPQRDIKWITTASQDESMQAFLDGRVDAFLGFPPQPQELRARRIGQMFLSTANDRPWSQYFCCMVLGNRDFVERYPIATKKVLRAILKAADVCGNEPERAARYMVDKGYVKDYTYALGLVTELPYRRWRDSDPEDSLRFYALRLREVGMVRNAPQKIISQGADWRFLNELKKEMKV
ncbi:MAG: ABC transporter substrate-binding protein [Burkholderiales bacterium]